MVIPIFTAEMNKFVFEKNIPYAFSFSFSLPYKLRLQTRHYYFATNKIIYKNLIKRLRRVVISLQNENLDKQKIALRHSTYVIGKGDSIGDEPVYSIVRTKLHFMIESFEDEKDLITKIFENENEKDNFIKEIMQITFEFFIFKYNESVGGKHFIIPSIYDCSHICFLFKKTKKKELEIGDQLLMCPNTFHEVGKYNEIPIDKIINRDFNVWLYFFNYSVYSYRVYDYFSSIVNAAISIESCVNSLIYDNNLSNKGFMTDKKGNYLSLYKKANKLINDKVIVSSLSLTEIENLINKILGPRNDIMDGKISDLMTMKNKATDSQKAINDLYLDFGIII